MISCKFLLITFKKVQVGKDQEKTQSEKDSHSKNRGGKNQYAKVSIYELKLAFTNIYLAYRKIKVLNNFFKIISFK